MICIKSPDNVLEINSIREIIERLLKEEKSYYDKGELQAVLDDVISKIEEKISAGGYIYRGEHECYESVSSNLYRQRKKNSYFFKDAPKEVDLPFLEETLVELAKRHRIANENKPLSDDEEILDEIQHWGGETNYIDFTERLEVALFFACFGSYDKDGRILLKQEKSVEEIRRPKKPETRVKAQRSVFIVNRSGTVEPDDEIVIPREFKHIILKALNMLSSPINVYTMYGDIWGYVRFSKEYREVYFRFINIYSQTRKWVESGFDDKKMLEKYAEKYRELSGRMPFIPQIHVGHATTQELLKKTDCSIKLCKEALSWDPYNCGALYSLGRAYLNKSGIITYLSDKKYINNSLAIFNKIVKENKSESEFMLVDCYLHRGKAHIVLKNFKLAILDFDKAIPIIRSINNRETSDSFINKLVECAACYHFGEALLRLDDKELVWSPNAPKCETIHTVKTLGRLETAKKMLIKVRDFDPSVYKKIKDPIIGRQGFKEAGIEIPDEIAKLLLR